MDILEHARAQRIGGTDGELVEALCDELERLRNDAARLDWLEQHAWATERECFDFVDAWRTPDGKRHNGGLRYAIDAAMTPNVKSEGAEPLLAKLPLD